MEEDVQLDEKEQDSLKLIYIELKKKEKELFELQKKIFGEEEAELDLKKLFDYKFKDRKLLGAS